MHNEFTHFPKDPNCEICQAAKSQRAPCLSGKGAKPDDTPVPSKFADAITADHAILNEDDEDRDGDQIACIIQDRATSWCEGYPCKSKTTAETEQCLIQFLGPQAKCEYAYTDNSGELKAALSELKIPHDTSTPHRPQTNRVAERAVRRVKEGTSCALV